MENIFDLNFFQKLNTLKLNSYIRTKQGMSGERKSGAKGSSVEFSDYREYFPGDDLRRIDWNVYGRTEKLYIKEFMEEKEIPFTLFLDTSASMDFGEKKKSILALQLTAAFSYLALHHMDRIKIELVGTGQENNILNARKTNNFTHILNGLKEVTFQGETCFLEKIKKTPIKQPGISILISDFFDRRNLEEAISYLKYKKQQIIILHILAREELESKEEGTVSFVDKETMEEVKVTISQSVLKMYEKTRKEFVRNIEEQVKKYQAAYVLAFSDESMEEVILDKLQKTHCLMQNK